MSPLLGWGLSGAQAPSNQAMHTNHLACVSLRVASGRQVNSVSLALFPSLLPPGLLVTNVYACMYIKGGRRHESGEEVGGGTIAVCVCNGTTRGIWEHTPTAKVFNQMLSDCFWGTFGWRITNRISSHMHLLFFSSCLLLIPILPLPHSHYPPPMLLLLLHSLFLSLLPPLISSFHSLPPIIS